MANLTTKAMRDIEVGNRVVGIDKSDLHRYTTTIVQAKWQTEKEAFDISLTNGVHLTCSSDHRWLTERGWKHTYGTMRGDMQRPYLTKNNRILGMGHLAQTPPITSEYMKGYISGMVRGDGLLKTFEYHAKARKNKQHQFRLALIDTEALDRVYHYLRFFGIVTKWFEFSGGTNHKMMAIRTSSERNYRYITKLIEFGKSTEWMRGWIAGIFDAEGSNSNGAIRISNTNEQILETTRNALEAYGFDCVREDHENHVSTIRVRGGLTERVRFFSIINSAIPRKSTIGGFQVKNSVKVDKIMNTRVSTEMFDITTATGNFVANGLISHNCYAPAALRMQRETHQKSTPRKNVMRLFEKDVIEMERKGDERPVMLSFSCDTYQHLDEQEMLTRRALKCLFDHGRNVIILTKGGKRSERDFDLLAANKEHVQYAVTLVFAEDAESLAIEPNAAPTSERIEVLERAHDLGIETWVSMEPVYYPEDTLELIDRTDHIADLYKVGTLNHQPEAKKIDWHKFATDVVAKLESIGADYYIKKDLRKHL